MNWFEIKNKTEDSAEVWIYDVIGEDFLGVGIVAKTFVKDLMALDVAHIALHINSPGGSVWDGQAIYNAIARHPAKVTTYVDGLAASIASVIALAGDTVIMAENALMMIHKGWARVIGNADEMRDSADVLDKIDETIAGIYERKTGKDSAEIASAMAEETWYTASEAVDFGLADQVEEGLQAAAMVIPESIKARYKHVPEDIDPPAQPVVETVPSGADEASGGAPQSKVYDFDMERFKHRRKSNA